MSRNLAAGSLGSSAPGVHLPRKKHTVLKLLMPMLVQQICKRTWQVAAGLNAQLGETAPNDSHQLPSESHETASFLAKARAVGDRHVQFSCNLR